MATCFSSALAVSTLNLTHSSSSSSSRSPKSRQLYQYSNEFFIPKTISKFNLSRRNVFSVFNSLVNNSSLDESYTAVHEVKTSTWRWRDYSIRYQYSGVSGPALILVHGFGANSDHWRKNLPVLAYSHRVYSIDLIGYGYSDKPNPRQFGVDYFYTFETWASQLNDFCKDIVKDEVFFICNSIGGAGLVGLQAAVMDPQICKGIILLNISLRMLHIKKQPWFGKPLIKSFQSLLRNTDLGKMFFKSVATPESVKNILCQCPVLIAWGDKDPWEPIELGKAYGQFESVEDFVVLPDVGHCPQDEAPHLVNPLIASFVAKHVPQVESLSTSAS